MIYVYSYLTNIFLSQNDFHFIEKIELRRLRRAVEKFAEATGRPPEAHHRRIADDDLVAVLSPSADDNPAALEARRSAPPTARRPAGTRPHRP
jgi:hypothetical protein